MKKQVEDKFLTVSVGDTRCPEKIRAVARSARTIYVLRERIDCGHWRHVEDCFHQITGTHILSEPIAARKYFTLRPKTVISRLTKAGVW
jgi:hypothetical protein